jgi:hypothetical protein
MPATAIVLVLWRMWFKFDHWRMMCGEVGSFWRDARIWLKSGRPAAAAEDVERGGVKSWKYQRTDRLGEASFLLCKISFVVSGAWLTE